MIGYTSGSWDILRCEDLKRLDRTIQISNDKGNKLFAIGIYDDNVCQALGLNKPIKPLEDRMKIVEQLRGVDFVFPVISTDKT